MFIKASIVIPARDEEARLEACIRSILKQDLPNVEIIVVNDGSTDGTRRVAEFFAAECKNVRVINLPPVGIAKAFNAGMREARGEYLGSIGADDRYLPGKLGEQAQYLDDHPEVGMVFGWPEFINEDGSPFDGESPLTVEALARPVNRSREEWRSQFAIGNCLFGPTGLYRRQLHQEFGFFDERLSMLADLDFYIQVARNWDIAVLQRPVAQVCIRDGISSPKNAEVCKHDADIIRRKGQGFGVVDCPYKGKLLIATPTRTGEAYADYIASLKATFDLLRAAGVDYDYWPLDGDSYVDRARNTICGRFRESDCTDLLFIDSDEGWDPMGVLRLILHEEEIVGGSYPIKNDWEQWSAVLKVDENRVPIGKLLPDGGALLEAEILPAGFLRIRKTALERFADHYPERWVTEPSADYLSPDRKYTVFFHRTYDFAHHCGRGEDTEFCRLWREMGGTLWVEPRLTIRHYGSKAWEGNLDGWLRKRKIDQLMEDMPLPMAAQ